MIGRKDQCEQVNRTLRTSLNEEIAKSGGLTEKCQLLEKELANSKQVYENRIQTIENENKLLKDQLKKYVSAVQLMRPANNDAASTQPMPAINPNLQRDYSYEAEQYEKKLIQVKFLIFTPFLNINLCVLLLGSWNAWRINGVQLPIT